MIKKIGRNDLCNCQSGKKYKKCCLNKVEDKKIEQRQRIIYGDEYSSPKMKEIATTLKKIFEDHEVLDVSKVANEETYKTLQLQHYTKKVIMLLERNEFNEVLFQEKCPDFINKLALYRGAYECIDETPDSYTGKDTYNIDSVCDMIQTRLDGDVWQSVTD